MSSYVTPLPNFGAVNFPRTPQEWEVFKRYLTQLEKIVSQLERPTVSTVASAASIAPLSGIVFISGTAAISTIKVNALAQLTFIPLAAFTTVTGGNIARATTAVVNVPLVMTYSSSNSLWYPSY